MFDKIPLDPATMEDWTYNGKKVYNYRKFINKDGNYVESFRTDEDGEWATIVPPEEWTDEIREFAKKV